MTEEEDYSLSGPLRSLKDGTVIPDPLEESEEENPDTPPLEVIDALAAKPSACFTNGADNGNLEESARALLGRTSCDPRPAKCILPVDFCPRDLD